VFNQAGKGLMVYVRERDKDGNLHGLIVHDERDATKTPSTIIASKGIVVATDTGQQVIVYNGSRQEYDDVNFILRRLNFDQYIIELPSDEGEPIAMRWREPDERSFFELFSPNKNDINDRDRLNEFVREIHKRITTPFLVISYAFIGLYFLLTGSLDRRGASRRILSAVVCMVVVQVCYMVSYNATKKLPMVIPVLYFVAITPAIIGLSLLWQPNTNIKRATLSDEVSS
jgi:lipopolysaccharide export system permease protein